MTQMRTPPPQVWPTLRASDARALIGAAVRVREPVGELAADEQREVDRQALLAVAEHREDPARQVAEAVREVVTARGGFLLELRGDEALVVFVSARNALRAAVELQDRFRESELTLERAETPDGVSRLDRGETPMPVESFGEGQAQH